MANFNYTRIRESFFANSDAKTNEARRASISYQIDRFLDDEGENGGELIFYNETMVDEGTVHVTVVFKHIIE